MRFRIKVPAREWVVITGAAHGLGRALAGEALKREFQVIGLDRDEQGLAELHHEFGNQKLRTHRIDISDAQALNEFSASLVEDGIRPVIWLNNAGLPAIGKLSTLTADEISRVTDVNLKGVIFGTQAALTVMTKPDRGILGNVASLNDTIPMPYMSLYVATKFGVRGFTEALRLELASEHSALNIVLISPGLMQTTMLASQKGFQFPPWLEFLTDKPDTVAQAIFRELLQGKTTIVPGAKAKLLHAIMQRRGVQEVTSRLLFAKDWKEVLGLNPIRRT